MSDLATEGFATHFLPCGSWSNPANTDAPQAWAGSDTSGSQAGTAAPECTKIAHRRSLAIFAADSGIAGNSAVGIKFVPFNRRENRRSLAIFFAEEIAHLGASKIARFCGGAVKIAAATAENRAILVHSELHRPNALASSLFGPSLAAAGDQVSGVMDRHPL